MKQTRRVFIQNRLDKSLHILRIEELRKSYRYHQSDAHLICNASARLHWSGIRLFCQSPPSKHYFADRTTERRRVR